MFYFKKAYLYFSNTRDFQVYFRFDDYPQSFVERTTENVNTFYLTRGYQDAESLNADFKRQYN